MGYKNQIAPTILGITYPGVNGEISPILSGKISYGRQYGIPGEFYEE